MTENMSGQQWGHSREIMCPVQSISLIMPVFPSCPHCHHLVHFSPSLSYLCFICFPGTFLVSLHLLSWCNYSQCSIHTQKYPNLAIKYVFTLILVQASIFSHFMYHWREQIYIYKYKYIYMYLSTNL